ncbi:(2Fe-2S)-binding protein [Aromatoleum toluolicum]|uniref:(2Fe-2S)-binding protein n=1 Tax=Aromatoleum toluolicum TaxID=90060 RepID=A0ABX1NCP9_9RHOO|nr:(2Fe-2S)-binding protein [Aromatoleum toluolicum]NMF96980.1 (2Fe-2S)-binding protein [Aromatoleum toluolicum]
MTGRFVRLAETSRALVRFELDGKPVEALAGDTLLVAILSNGTSVRSCEFGGGRRAGFCLMGACQDCWVWTAAGDRLRSCTTMVEEGMRILTSQPEASWVNVA